MSLLTCVFSIYLYACSGEGSKKSEGSSAGALPDAGSSQNDGGLLPNPPGCWQAPSTAFDLAAFGAVELLEEGFLFTEGPLWRTASQDLLFSDIDADTIYRWPGSGTSEVFRAPSEHSNGLKLDHDGLLLTTARDPGRVLRIDEQGTPITVADAYNGQPLLEPNDLAVRSDGTIYFTDPTFDFGNTSAVQGVYRVNLDGTLVREVDNLRAPNGVALSPDEDTLYVGAAIDAKVVAYDVATDGSLSGARDFATASAPDGIAVDTLGNLYVAATNGIRIFDPSGASLGVLSVPRAPSNCAFGGSDGRTLFITARQGLYQVSAPVAGDLGRCKN